MSLPKHYRETLLSAALDGELTAQEQVEFDREFAVDHSFAREFEELQLLRSELRSSFSGLRKQRISPDVSARISAAIAATEIIAGPSPAFDSLAVPEVFDRPSRASKLKRVAAVLALAASILFAVTLWNRNDAEAPVRNSIAALSNVQSLPDASDANPGSTGEQPDQAESPDFESMAANQPMVSDDASKFSEPGLPPKVMSIKPDPSPDLASAPRPRTASPVQPIGVPEQSVDRTALSVVLVLSVELTDLGRRQHALSEALRATDIRLGEESVMGDKVVSHLRDSQVIDANAADGTEAANLFFVEASAKRIDRFMSHLLSDPESFSSVVLGLATDPPLLASVGELREIDPTKVRQDVSFGIAHGIVSSDRRSLAVDPDYPFIPLSPGDSGLALLNPGNESEANKGSDSSASVVDDFPSQLLLLVK